MVVTLLGGIAFVSSGLMPSPFDKIFVVFQATAFALSSLLIARNGAVYSSIINGVLLSIFRIGYFPFSLFFSMAYGMLVDGFFHAFRIRGKTQLHRARLTVALAFATVITGVASMYTTTIMGLLPMLPALYLAIFAIGILNAVAASYLTSFIWNRYLTGRTRINS